MKLTTLIITVCFLQVSALTRAQITLKESKASLEKVLEKIGKQSGYDFIYSKQDFKDTEKLNIKLNNVSVERALEVCFAGQPLSYEISERTVMVKRKKEKSILDRVIEYFINIDVKGRVVDEKGDGLAGASVKVKGSDKATTTNNNGEFSLSGIDENATLVISFIGYKTKEIAANGNLDIIQLDFSQSKLDEIQIIGYGTVSKRLNPGNVTSVSEKVIQGQPITSIAQGLSGRVAGLQVTQTNGLPGSAINVQIRGRNSIGANNNPLYIVDGIPFVSNAVERINGPQGAGTGSPLNLISPSDIESIDILKDAAATAIYGSRASNGVVLITTKKGETGKTRFNVTVNSGASEVTRVAKTMSTAQFLQFRKDAFANSGVTPTAGTAPDLMLWDQNADFNWQDWYIGNPAHFTDASATLTGGTRQTTFLVGGNYHRETNVLPGNDAYNRGNLHLSLVHGSPDKKFNITTSIFYTADQNNLPYSAASLREIATAVPNYPVYNNTGSFNWTAGKDNYAARNTAYYKAESGNLNSNITLSYVLASGLDLKLNTGFNQLDNRQIAANPSTSINPDFQLPPYSTFTNQRTKTLIAEPQVNYKHSIGKGDIDILAGATIQSANTKGQSISAGNYSNDLLIESLSYGTVSGQSSTNIDYKYLSFFARTNYTLLNRYIASATFRRDGSSRFGVNRQFGNFGSIGLAWLFTNEDFFRQKLPLLSSGKLRGSYGTTGNDGIRDYGFLNLYNNTNPYGSTVAIQPSQIANSRYQWEVNKKLEVALETGFFKDRILLNIAFYRNRSGNQLVGFDLPSTTGFTSYQANLPAVVQNQGWEFEFNTINVEGKGFKWISSANLTVPKNKLVSFPGLSTSTYANSLIIGESLNTVQLFNFLGVDPKTGKPLLEDVNQNGSYDYEVSSYNNQGGDYVNVGNTDPKWYGGLYNSVSYKGISIDFLLQYVKQDGYSQIRYSGFGRVFNNFVDNLDYWKKEGDIVDIPKPFSNSNANNTAYAFSSAIFTDASFLRLKNLSIAYSIPPKALKSIGFQQLKIQARGQNLLTFTKYKGYDPETAGNLIMPIPPMKTFTIGLSATF